MGDPFDDVKFKPGKVAEVFAVLAVSLKEVK